MTHLKAVRTPGKAKITTDEKTGTWKIDSWIEDVYFTALLHIQECFNIQMVEVVNE